MQRKIIHCDADCFFAAIEMRDNIALQGIPLAVGGDPSRRGVIATCNYEARAFGVRSAMASAYAKKLCPQLRIVPHSMEKYRIAAQQMRAIFEDYTHLVEPLSLDEAFLDVSSTRLCRGSATLIAEEIRRRVSAEIGITVSIGISSNKFLAKIASDWKKPDGLTVIEPSQVSAFMPNLPVSSIPGVGRKTLAKLNNIGIHYCSDINSNKKIELIQRFGKFGQRLSELAEGRDDREVQPHRPRKSISVEKTLDQDIAHDKSEPVLSELYLRLCERISGLSKNGLSFTDSSSKETPIFSSIFLKITFNDFSKTTVETSDQSHSLSAYRQLLDVGWKRYQKPIRLLGVGVRLSEAPGDIDIMSCQLDFFVDESVIGSH